MIKCWFKKENDQIWRLTFTTTSRPSPACRLKCTISGLRPVSICLYIWWHVSISSTARSMWSPGRPLWAPSAKVPGRKHTRWSWRVTRERGAIRMRLRNDQRMSGWNWLDCRTDWLHRSSYSESLKKTQRLTELTKRVLFEDVGSLTFGSVQNILGQSGVSILCVVHSEHSRPWNICISTVYHMQYPLNCILRFSTGPRSLRGP